MYRVSIVNGDVETTINEVSESAMAPRVVTGSVKQAINSIDSFKFEILPNNPGFYMLQELKTWVKVLNVKNNQCEFEGRVLICNDVMNEDGSISKSVTCEGELAYLQDSNQIWGEYHDATVRHLLEVMIENHNKLVSEDKRFVVGNVTVTDSNNSLYRFLGYDKTWDTIQDKLIDRLGGEIQLRKVNGVRYIDYLTEIGGMSNVDIVLSKNMKSIEREIDSTEIITRLIPLGAEVTMSLEDTEENAEKTDETQEISKPRMDISIVNNGCIYLDDTEAIQKFGIITGTVIWNDVYLSENLKKKGQAYLEMMNKVSKRFKVGVVDLWQLGLDMDTFKVGNYHNVVNPLMGINESLRIIEKEIRIEAPEESSLTFGEKFDSIRDYQKKANKVVKTAGQLEIFNK